MDVKNCCIVLQGTSGISSVSVDVEEFLTPRLDSVTLKPKISKQRHESSSQENTLPTDIDRNISKRTEQPLLNKRNGKDDSKLIIIVLTSPILSH